MVFWITDGVLHEQHDWLHKDEGISLTISEDTEEFIIPEGVTSFDSGMFIKMSKLKKISPQCKIMGVHKS